MSAAPGGASVLHLISSLEAGGAQTMLGNLVLSTTPGAWHHHVVAMLDGGSQADILRAGGLTVETLGMRRGQADPRGALRFAGIVRRVRPSIIQTWLYHADLLGLIGRPLAGARVVWNIRSAIHDGIDSTITKLCARLSALPDAVVVNSTAGRRVHEERGYHPRRWCLIGNGFDLEVYAPSAAHRRDVRQELGLAADTPLVGLIARLDPHKGHDLFVDAARRVIEQRPDVHFLLVGDQITKQNAPFSSIGPGRLLDQMHLLDRRGDIPRLTAALDVASCTSTAEAFPNVVGEAMACGVPCVVTHVGDAADVVADPSLVVPSGDAAALAAGWLRVLNMSPSDRQALGDRLRQRVAAHYSLPVVVRQYEDLYRSLIDR
jgi:glycosyltransferase involved in cell wall biosynthesis